jgi:hypothetical protein
MDIDDPTEVAAIRDEVTAQWGGIMDLETKRHRKSLKGTGERPPGPAPDGYVSGDSNPSAEDSTEAIEDRTNGSTDNIDMDVRVLY